MDLLYLYASSIILHMEIVSPTFHNMVCIIHHSYKTPPHGYPGPHGAEDSEALKKLLTLRGLGDIPRLQSTDLLVLLKILTTLVIVDLISHAAALVDLTSHVTLGACHFHRRPPPWALHPGRGLPLAEANSALGQAERAR